MLSGERSFGGDASITVMSGQPVTQTPWHIRSLLKPHSKALTIGMLAVIGEGIANLLEPWPLKLVLDNVLKSRPMEGWLNQLILSTIGDDKLAILNFAALAVLTVALFGALCSYLEKSVTTS